MQQALEGVRQNSTSTLHPTTEILLLSYHGVGIMNTTLFPTWDEYFGQLLQQPAESYIIQSNNPYVPDYDLEINPGSLCSRIISIREQISNEFVNDLDVIADLGGQTLENYWDELKRSSQEQNPNSSQDNEPQEQPSTNSFGNMLFLELSPNDYYDRKPSPLR